MPSPSASTGGMLESMSTEYSFNLVSSFGYTGHWKQESGFTDWAVCRAGTAPLGSALKWGLTYIC